MGYISVNDKILIVNARKRKDGNRKKFLTNFYLKDGPGVECIDY